MAATCRPDLEGDVIADNCSSLPCTRAQGSSQICFGVAKPDAQTSKSAGLKRGNVSMAAAPQGGGDIHNHDCFVLYESTNFQVDPASRTELEAGPSLALASLTDVSAPLEDLATVVETGRHRWSKVQRTASGVDDSGARRHSNLNVATVSTPLRCQWDQLFDSTTLPAEPDWSPLVAPLILTLPMPPTDMTDLGVCDPHGGYSPDSQLNSSQWLFHAVFDASAVSESALTASALPVPVPVTQLSQLEVLAEITPTAAASTRDVDSLATTIQALAGSGIRCAGPESGTATQGSQAQPSPAHFQDSEIQLEALGLAQHPDPLATLAPSRSRRRSGRLGPLPRGAVATLKAWMTAPCHVEHPYPTDAEKLYLSVTTGLTQRQISVWFVNARKRFWRQAAALRIGTTSRSTASGSSGSSRRQRPGVCSSR